MSVKFLNPYAWKLIPLTKEDRGPIPGGYPILHILPPHPIFEEIDSGLQNAMEWMYPFEKTDYIKQNYNRSIESRHWTGANQVFEIFREKLPDIIGEEYLRLVTTKSTYDSGLHSKVLHPWIPVLEESEEYGKLTYGNLYSIIVCIYNIIRAPDPYKALQLQEVPG